MNLRQIKREDVYWAARTNECECQGQRQVKGQSSTSPVAFFLPIDNAL